MLTQEDLIEASKLDEAIDRLLAAMSHVECDSGEYAKMADQLIKLYKVKEIHSNIKLKAFDAVGKRKDQKRTFELKRNELIGKHEEVDNNLDMKKEELALRKDEFQLRRDEFLITEPLRTVETDLKREQIGLLNQVNKDTWALIGANLIGILLIIGYERVNVLTSKAVSFVTRLR